MDIGYHLLMALGFEGMAKQVRSKKENTTSSDCLNFIIETAKSRGIWETETQMCQDILNRMEIDKMPSN